MIGNGSRWKHFTIRKKILSCDDVHYLKLILAFYCDFSKNHDMTEGFKILYRTEGFQSGKTTIVVHVLFCYNGGILLKSCIKKDLKITLTIGIF